MLSIETQVREDAIRLFGFRSDVEREWFRLLQTVQGVGSKVALAILSMLDPGGLANAIGTQDKAMVARAPGVGPKLAARIVAELKDKAPASAGSTRCRAPRRPGRGPQRAQAGRGCRVRAHEPRLRPGAGLRRRRRRAPGGG